MRTSAVSYGFLWTFLGTLFLLRFWQAPTHPEWMFALLGTLAGTGIALAVLLPKHRMIPAVIAAAAVGLCAAVLAAAHAEHRTGPHDIEALAHGQAAQLHGWIVDAPDVRPTVTKLTIAVNRVKDAAGTHDAEGRILFNDYGAWPPLRYGDEVTVSGKLALPQPIDDFDYPHYLELAGIRAVVTRGSIRRAADGEPQPSFARTWTFLGGLIRLRTRIEDQIGLVLPEPHASLLAGLVTGTRRGLPARMSDEFRRAGITHIIAVSGYNVTIVLTLLGGLLFWIPLKKRLLPLSLAAVLFCLFVGAGAPVVRATIMGILGLLALQAERTTTPRLTILWTAFLMTAWNPLSLWYDASFQLSFLAVLGINELSPLLLRLLRRVPEAFAIRESLVATLAAEIATIPVTVLLFHQFSLVAPLTNILVAPLIPLSMLLGSVATLLSFLWMPLGLVAGYYAWALLQTIIVIAHLCASVPLASLAL